MRVNARQIIPVKIDMSEQEAIIAILKNRGWYDENISVQNNMLILSREGRDDKIISEDPNDVEIFLHLTAILDLVEA